MKGLEGRPSGNIKAEEGIDNTSRLREGSAIVMTMMAAGEGTVIIDEGEGMIATTMDIRGKGGTNSNHEMQYCFEYFSFYSDTIRHLHNTFQLETRQKKGHQTIVPRPCQQQTSSLESFGTWRHDQDTSLPDIQRCSNGRGDTLAAPLCFFLDFFPIVQDTAV